jgi:hypothetical protein
LVLAEYLQQLQRWLLLQQSLLGAVAAAPFKEGFVSLIFHRRN